MPAAAALMAATTNSTCMETETQVLPVENASKGTISDDYITDNLPTYLSGIEEIQHDFAASVDQIEEADERIELMNSNGPNESSWGENKDLSSDSEVGMRETSFTDEIGEKTFENVMELNGLAGNNNDDDTRADGIGEDFVLNADRESRKTAFEVLNDFSNGVLDNNPNGVGGVLIQNANMESGMIFNLSQTFRTLIFLLLSIIGEISRTDQPSKEEEGEIGGDSIMNFIDHPDGLIKIDTEVNDGKINF